jgi:methionyl-tRNA formyltransferase
MKKLNVLLSGQKRFGRSVLQLLGELGHNVAAVCAPTTGQGTAEEDRLHFAAAQARLPIIQAGTLTHEVMPEGVDLIVTAHSHDFVGRKTRMRAALGAIGYHPSLLPVHRGRDAVRWAVRLGERITGGTVYWLNDTVDGGPVAAQEHAFIRPGDDARELWTRELAPLGLRLFRKVLDDISKGKIVRIPQEHTLATWEPAISGQPRLFRPDLDLLQPPGSGLTYIVTRE